MAAPAASSSSALIPSFLSAASSLSVQAKDLLNITPEQLKKSGFDSKIWINYFVSTFHPQHLARIQIIRQQETAPELLATLVKTDQDFEQAFKKLIAQLYLLPSNGKAWKNRPAEIEKTLQLVSKIEVLDLAAYCQPVLSGTGQHGLQELVKKLQKIQTEQGFGYIHLIHLLLDRMSLEYNPTNENCFIVKGNPTTLLALKEKGFWRAKPIREPQDTSLTFETWEATKSYYPQHSVLIKGTELIFGVPFIGISFTLVVTSEEVDKAISTHKPILFTDNKTDMLVLAAYSMGTPPQRDMGNAISFLVTANPTDPVIISPEENDNRALREHTQMAIQAMQKIWLEEIQTKPLEKFKFNYLYFLPKTPEEADEKMIGALELALEKPEENAPLIEWIADQYDFDYSKEEIEQAKQIAGVSSISIEEEQKEEEELSVAPAAIAHAVLQKLKKQKPSAQRAKEHSIQASSAASSSSKRQLLSNDELKAQLSASSMEPKLKERAIGVLSGQRLANKREEDKFFLEIIRHQANVSGSIVQKGSKGGSHRSYKLTKRAGKSGKVTYRATTLVNNHGADANRGSDLSSQQTNLLRLFTPLG